MPGGEDGGEEGDENAAREKEAESPEEHRDARGVGHVQLIRSTGGKPEMTIFHFYPQAL